MMDWLFLAVLVLGAIAYVMAKEGVVETITVLGSCALLIVVAGAVLAVLLLLSAPW